MTLSDAIHRAARRCMQDALKQTNGNVQAAARILGVNRSDFYKRAVRYGVSITRKRRSVSVVQEMAMWRRA